MARASNGLVCILVQGGEMFKVGWRAYRNKINENDKTIREEKRNEIETSVRENKKDAVPLYYKGATGSRKRSVR